MSSLPPRIGPGLAYRVRVDLGDALNASGDKLWYDFGDDWNHVIMLEDIGELLPDSPRARVVGGRRAAPADDCGGIPGYEHLNDVLRTDHPEHKELSVWAADMGLGPADEFDPDAVDLEEPDRVVRQLV